MENRSKGNKSGLQRWADRQAAAQLASLYVEACDGDGATGRVQSEEWEIRLAVRSLRDLAAENAELTPIQRRVLDVVSERQPLLQAEIAGRIEAEDGEYLYKALRGLYKLGRIVDHVQGWVRFA